MISRSDSDDFSPIPKRSWYDLDMIPNRCGSDPDNAGVIYDGNPFIYYPSWHCQNGHDVISGSDPDDQCEIPMRSGYDLDMIRMRCGSDLGNAGVISDGNPCFHYPSCHC